MTTTKTLFGLNDNADLYLEPSDGMPSRARDLTAHGILAGEASSLYHRAALASAEGRNDSRDALEKQANDILSALGTFTGRGEYPAPSEEETRIANKREHFRQLEKEDAKKDAKKNRK